MINEGTTTTTTTCHSSLYLGLSIGWVLSDNCHKAKHDNGATNQQPVKQLTLPSLPTPKPSYSALAWAAFYKKKLATPTPP